MIFVSLANCAALSTSGQLWELSDTIHGLCTTIANRLPVGVGIVALLVPSKTHITRADELDDY
jgi:hypothetical protein